MFMDELRVPNTGSTSGWEKGVKICPACNTRNTVENIWKEEPIRNLNGEIVGFNRELRLRRCTSCGERFNVNTRIERVK
jgi:Zn ribbon nucleic-acid-binding protein